MRKGSGVGLSLRIIDKGNMVAERGCIFGRWRWGADTVGGTPPPSRDLVKHANRTTSDPPGVVYLGATGAEPGIFLEGKCFAHHTVMPHLKIRAFPCFSRRLFPSTSTGSPICTPFTSHLTLGAPNLLLCEQHRLS